MHHHHSCISSSSSFVVYSYYNAVFIAIIVLYNKAGLVRFQPHFYHVDELSDCPKRQGCLPPKTLTENDTGKRILLPAFRG